MELVEKTQNIHRNFIQVFAPFFGQNAVSNEKTSY